MDVFFSDDDRVSYLRLLREQGKKFGVQYLAWCLMDNHVHVIAVPERESSLAKGLGEAHKRYTSMVNRREGWTGYLFQGRFFSCPLDGSYAIAAIRYVLRNPVRAGICRQPWDYRWSSAQWMIGSTEVDPLVRGSSLLEEVSDWKALLEEEPLVIEDVRHHTRTGRPLGSSSFVDYVESATGRMLHTLKRGPKRKK